MTIEDFLSLGYEPVIGMEIHAEIKTKSKMFCSCKNDPFSAKKPNIYTCPTCLGLPGALPKANKKAVYETIRLGYALNCKINSFSKFDRKHYFYPDLPKGYQVSQYDIPFCYRGYISTSAGKVRIRRIHLEEDTAKLMHETHNGKKITLVDFNRSGVPLIEIVSEPDIRSAQQAKEYARALYTIIRYLEISDCDMQKGAMRLEANVSLRKKGEGLPLYKVELKNINSFKFLEKAVNYELNRQYNLIKKGRQVIQETRGYNENNQKTYSQRSKEEAEDYRYFPDPDLPPVALDKKTLLKLEKSIPALPFELAEEWSNKYNISEQIILKLIDKQKDAEFLKQIIFYGEKAKLSLKKLFYALLNKEVSRGALPEKVILEFKKLNTFDEIDKKELDSAIQDTLLNNKKAADQYKSGKTQALNFLLGQTMKKLRKKTDATLVRQALIKELKT